ncbi:MAG: hypothetical protein Q8M93_01545 [Polaromonas sp.]|uniref:hypothetical protein n=1 Tax=Polaromonas sp. TaxID=1869339 RepID=UPI0027305BE6|nr:hypothetical protein [Polaromonas sp.]MDP2450603.1 hypothetical protein [Polaromonas sp.]MDP3245631.1 hypothetical protein [Polaromonas sp.]
MKKASLSGGFFFGRSGESGIKSASIPYVTGASSYENSSENEGLIQSPRPWSAEAQGISPAEKALLRVFF